MIISMFVLSCALSATAYALSFTSFKQKFGGDFNIVVSGGQFSIVGRSAKPVLDLAKGADAALVLKDTFGANELHYRSTSESIGTKHFTYVQTINGEPVENLAITISVDRSGFILAVTGRFQALVNAPAPVRLTKPELLLLLPKEACEFANAAGDENRGKTCNPLNDPIAIPAPEDVEGPFLFAAGTGMVRAYSFVLRTDSGIGVAEYFVDASTDEFHVLARREVLHPRRPKGDVFNPNPRASAADLSLNYNNLGARRDFYSHVRLRDMVQSANGVASTLTGRYVRLNDMLAAPKSPPVVPINGSFASRRGDLAFASLMLYVHIDGMQRYVQSLGFKNLLNYAIAADPEIRSPNSFADTSKPRSPAVLFGKGLVFLAEDGDLIAHEYGHALQAAAAGKRFNPQDTDFETGAMLEGFADYWAMTYFRGQNRRYAGRAMAGECFAEWGTQQPCGCTRVVKLNATRCDLQQIPDHHANGSVWTATLWEIAAQIGARKADRLVLESHFFVPERPDFCMGGMALIAADEALWRGARRGVITRILQDRKIFNVTDCQPQMVH